MQPSDLRFCFHRFFAENVSPRVSFDCQNNLPIAGFLHDSRRSTVLMLEDPVLDRTVEACWVE